MNLSDIVTPKYEIVEWVDSASTQAGELALQELEQGRYTMILFPTHRSWAAIAFEMGRPPTGIFLRFSNDLSSLKRPLIDTLILVAADNDGWDEEGVSLAMERLSASEDPKIVEIRRDA
jgi:hypothetical protein